jgi:lipopolysaccharide transport system ATP-binding protein
MTPAAITVENLGKMYRLGAAQKRAETFQEVLTGMALSPLRRLQQLRGVSSAQEEFWALKDVSFEVKRGDVVGIIGRNGAGKSTLLKVLSRIVEPTLGQAVLRGRVASLLEVGTGFHPELTGRENIFLNGSILGMKHREIEAKFDEIVAFAEVERFIDTPVKRYSSGMYVRLAFAVAAHLDPEILIVDEVLAVGDIEFQKKCLGKMRQVSAGGERTVLFVSHNMMAIQSLCSRGILLASGTVAVAGSATEAISAYTALAGASRSQRWKRPEGSVRAAFCIESAELEVLGSQPNHVLRCRVIVRTCSHAPAAIVALDIHDLFGSWLMQAIPRVEPFITSAVMEHELTVEVELPPLIPGTYVISVWVGNGLTQTIDWAREIASFDIAESPTPGRTIPHSSDRGYCVPVSRVSIVTTA